MMPLTPPSVMVFSHSGAPLLCLPQPGLEPAQMGHLHIIQPGEQPASSLL
jgi:hypothetical protein